MTSTLYPDAPPTNTELLEAKLKEVTLGLTEVASSRYGDEVCSVGKDMIGQYNVVFIFLLGGKAVHSFDAQAVGADDALRALARRTTTNHNKEDA